MVHEIVFIQSKLENLSMNIIECYPAVVAWIVRALLLHSAEEYILVIGGLNPAKVINMVANASAVYVHWNCNPP